jgi:hypothetical protein
MTPGSFETVRVGAVEGSDTGEVLLCQDDKPRGAFFLMWITCG